jgi:hypothetical protein
MHLRNGGNSFDWFFLAMAHWRLGHQADGRLWYARAAEWMDKNQPNNEELLRFRAEAAELLGRKEPPKIKGPAAASGGPTASAGIPAQAAGNGRWP